MMSSKGLIMLMQTPCRICLSASIGKYDEPADPFSVPWLCDGPGCSFHDDAAELFAAELVVDAEFERPHEHALDLWEVADVFYVPIEQSFDDVDEALGAHLSPFVPKSVNRWSVFFTMSVLMRRLIMPDTSSTTM